MQHDIVTPEQPAQPTTQGDYITREEFQSFEEKNLAFWKFMHGFGEYQKTFGWHHFVQKVLV